MRRSVQGQARFALAEQREDHDWMEEAALMQAEALEQVGLQPSSRNLAQLRAAALQHPEIALYVVHNLNRDGALIEGDEAPRMNLLTLDGVEEEWPPTTLRAGVPMVVVAGSVS